MVVITCPRLLTLLASPNTVSVTLLLYLRLPSRAMGIWTWHCVISTHVCATRRTGNGCIALGKRCIVVP